MSTINVISEARDSYRRKQWSRAYERFSEADAGASLAIEDLEQLAMAAYLTGRDDESSEAWTRAHQESLADGKTVRAARCAFWLGFGLVMRGEPARGSGWLARAQRLLDEEGGDHVERGYLLLPLALRTLSSGDHQRAIGLFSEAADVGRRFHDDDLTALARLGRGQSLIRTGSVQEGVALLDDVMVAVEADELSAMVAGVIYCAVLEACREIFDLHRAQEWTAAMTRWCESQPDLVPYRGQCLVRRAEVMQLHGAWSDALEETRRACQRLSGPPGEPAAGAAFYQEAELHRLRGDFGTAEEAYREASKWGREPQPGLALLRLTQGRLDAAEAAIRRVVEEARGPAARSQVLHAHVEIMLAAGDLVAARASAGELSQIAEGFHSPLLHASAMHARASVLLAEGETSRALSLLHESWAAWEELQVPYEAARVRVLIGLACREIGDRDSAEMELAAARFAFERLGARPDLDRLDALTGGQTPAETEGLTRREREVLRLIAAGSTNKQIAGELFISERTVERHVSNIFNKLGVSSRAAATAYAYEHRLV